MKVLLTGGLGYIGSHICLELLINGYEVVIVDSLRNSDILVFERLKNIISQTDSKLTSKVFFYECDLRDEIKLRDIFQSHIDKKSPIVAVIHCAGLKSIEESFRIPIEYWGNNVSGSIVLMKIMEDFKCNKLIFSSSASIYGLSGGHLIKEDAKIEPINPYGRTKAIIEYLLKDIFQTSSNNWRIANLRYFNPVGAHSSCQIGESPKCKPNNIFPIINKVASGEIDSFKIYGNDWNTHDGTGIRDYIHVMDLAEGHILALNFLINSEKNFINLNLGTGIGTSVLELIDIFQKVNNVVIPYVFSTRRKGDYGSVIADNSKATSLLSWQPKRSLEQMCKDSWKWQLTNPIVCK